MEDTLVKKRDSKPLGSNGEALKRPEIKPKRKAFRFKTNHGLAKQATVNLILKKMNFTEKELTELKANSVLLSNASVKVLEKKSQQESADLNKLLSKAVSYTAFPKPATIIPYGVPFPPAPPPFDKFMNPDKVIRNGRHLHAEGQGDGFITQEWGWTGRSVRFF